MCDQLNHVQRNRGIRHPFCFRLEKLHFGYYNSMNKFELKFF